MPRTRRSDRQAGQSAPEPSTSPLRNLRTLRGWNRRPNAGDRSRLPHPEPDQSELVPVLQSVPPTSTPMPVPHSVPSESDSMSVPQLVPPEPDPAVFFEESSPIIPEPILPVYRVPPRPNRRDFVSRNVDAAPNFDSRTREGRTARRAYQDELTHRESAADRVRVRDARLDQEWEENVRKYGEKEARRRQFEEWQVLKNLQKLDTSDAEELAREELNANPLITVAVQYRVDRKVCWQTNVSEKPLDEFDLASVEQQLDNAIETQHGMEQGWRTTSIIAIVKSKHSRAVRKQQTMEDLSPPQWIAVAELIVAEATAWKPQLTVSINIAAEADANMTKLFKLRATKRSRDEVSDPVESDPFTPTPRPPRRVRTNQLLDQAETRVAAAEEVGKYHKRLTDRWLCSDERCINSTHGKGWCFVDWGGDHYNMDEKQHVQWAKAIMQGDFHVSIEQPPRTLYLHWTKVQGPVSEFSKKSKQQSQREEVKQQMTEFKHGVGKTKSFMQQMQEMQEMQTRQRMQEMMEDSMERQNARMEKKEQLREQREQLEIMKTKELMKTQSSSHQSLMHEAYVSSLQPHPHFAPVNVFQQPANDQSMPPSLLSHNRSSSPIGQPQNEFQTMKDFFDWKIKQTTYEPTIKQLTAVRQTVEDKAFKFKHLKIMSDPINFMHRKAIELGISDDMALNFAHDLKQFKQVWRSAQRLMDM